MFNMLYNLKRSLASKTWLMYVAIAAIILGAALNIFFELNVALKIIIGIVVILAFALLVLFLIAGDDNTQELVETMSLFKLQVKSKTDKAVDNIMIISYSAVVVLGTFLNSLMVICIGILLFVIHCAAAIIARIYYTKKYR